MRRSTSAALWFALLLAAAPAAAQDAEAAPDEAESNTARVAEDNPDDDVTLALNAGANLAYGNAQSLGFNLGGLFQLRQGMHGFLAELTWLYGTAATRNDPTGPDPNEFGPLIENANNLNGRVRYDAFLDADNAIYVTARIRRDPFARLLPRFQGQAGYMRNFLREENHRFWGEVGLDFTYDRFAEDLAVGGTDGAGNPITSTDRGVGSLRLFIGYDNQINEVLTYTTGFEFLWGPLRTVGEGQIAAMRFEWVNQFRSKIEDWLQISLDVTARLDSAPPGQREAWNEQDNQATQMFDLIATLNLVGQFDLDGESAAEEPPAEEPSCPVCPVCAECEVCEDCAAVEPVVEEPVEAPARSDAPEGDAEAEPAAEPTP